ncbi:hypothetical protein GCM10010168_38150 [Actinoplanes ianthinogenes]|uniref:Uncharacterized protein n=1 Tax=Actinoplanes ianthinogenes TaxID=122358 RepID=A0ABN6CNA2_9ACTN|nr:hypothetical protein [Actinoplanes ianthinogenes]BCJ46662.1 hypothetical protein Aiant_73190 [Actinoplanes ianthinogenes]GGR16550.1 hypothetical protein GCM10010168_38150 [Actinoplanes ianthinogenes]
MEPVRRHLVAIPRHRPVRRAAVHRHLVAIPRARADPEPTLVLDPVVAELPAHAEPPQAGAEPPQAGAEPPQAGAEPLPVSAEPPPARAEPPPARSVLAVLASFALLTLLCCGAVVSVFRLT